MEFPITVYYGQPPHVRCRCTLKKIMDFMDDHYSTIIRVGERIVCGLIAIQDLISIARPIAVGEAMV